MSSWVRPDRHHSGSMSSLGQDGQRDTFER